LPDLIKRYAGTAKGQIADPDIRRGLIRHEMKGHAQRLTQQRVLEELKSHAPGFASSAVKLSGALLTQEGDELLLAAMGTRGIGWNKAGVVEERSATTNWLRNKSLTIAGGTKEIQLNIIAKRVLGLPD
jgi:alkylation response protein AidB-like acyl-CoA dehydrogenase